MFLNVFASFLERVTLSQTGRIAARIGHALAAKDVRLARTAHDNPMAAAMWALLRVAGAVFAVKVRNYHHARRVRGTVLKHDNLPPNDTTY
jgi:hypothetical protein